MATHLKERAGSSRDDLKTQQTKKSHDGTNIFGPGTPSRHLRMNQEGNILATEIIAYLPNWLRSHDIIRRVIENGGDPKIIAKIVNYLRRPTKGYAIKDNSLRHNFRNEMRAYEGLETWTVVDHQKGAYDSHYGDNIDPSSLNLTGFRPSCVDSDGTPNGRPEVENAPFESLATNVKCFPSIRDGDGLDLTLCLRHVLANLQYAFLFPRDFEFLTEVCGGPLPVYPAHFDGARFRHWDRKPSTVQPSNAELLDAQSHESFKFTETQRVEVEQHFQAIGVAVYREGHNVASTRSSPHPRDISVAPPRYQPTEDYNYIWEFLQTADHLSDPHRSSASDRQTLRTDSVSEGDVSDVPEFDYAHAFRSSPDFLHRDLKTPEQQYHSLRTSFDGIAEDANIDPDLPDSSHPSSTHRVGGSELPEYDRVLHDSYNRDVPSLQSSLGMDPLTGGLHVTHTGVTSPDLEPISHNWYNVGHQPEESGALSLHECVEHIEPPDYYSYHEDVDSGADTFPHVLSDYDGSDLAPA